MTRTSKKVKDYRLEFPIHAPKGIETYLKAAGIYRDCRKKDKTVRKTVDCVIAAICIKITLPCFIKTATSTLLKNARD